MLMLIAVLACSIQAKGGDDNTSSEPIKLEITPAEIKTKPLRAPLHVNLEAKYDAVARTISILYNGEAEGEVLLYSKG